MSDPEHPAPRPSSPNVPAADLRTLVGVLRRHLWVVVGLTLITTATAAILTMRQTPLYESHARVLVLPLNPNQLLQGVNYSFLVSMQTEAALATSPAVGRLAADRVEAEVGSRSEVGSVSVSVPTDTTFLDFSYADPDPAASRRWAQAYAEAYVEDREARALESYASASAGYQRSIDDLQVELTDAIAALDQATAVEQPTLQERVDTLRSQINVLLAQQAGLPVPGSDTAQIVASAKLPTAPSSPNTFRNVLLAALLGLALGATVTVVRERLDDRMLGREDLEDQIGAPTLAIVPHIGGRGRRLPRMPSLDHPHGGPAESYRAVRASLEYMTRTTGQKAFLITSASLNEGKTMTTANLAVTLARTGKRVIAISCDLRKPTLHRYFKIGNDVGLTGILRGEATIADAAQRCGIDTLRVIACGPVPDDPAELLGSPAMRSLLEDLSLHADYILLDSPPVLAVADPLILAAMVDGILIVADAGSTSRSAVAHVRELLEQVGANVVGGIFNNFDPRRVKYYPRYYRYYYSYQRQGGAAVEPAGNGRRPAPGAADIWPELAEGRDTRTPRD